jgi:hypothetical protein
MSSYSFRMDKLICATLDMLSSKNQEDISERLSKKIAQSSSPDEGGCCS